MSKAKERFEDAVREYQRHPSEENRARQQRARDAYLEEQRPYHAPAVPLSVAPPPEPDFPPHGKSPLTLSGCLIVGLMTIGALALLLTAVVAMALLFK